MADQMLLKDQTELFVCECSHHDHIAIAEIFDWSDDGEERPEHLDFNLAYHLAPKPLFQRIKNAVRYVVGIRSSYGDFDEMLLSIESATRLRDMLHKYICEYDRRKLNISP